MRSGAQGVQVTALQEKVEALTGSLENKKHKLQELKSELKDALAANQAGGSLNVELRHQNQLAQ